MDNLSVLRLLYYKYDYELQFFLNDFFRMCEIHKTKRIWEILYLVYIKGLYKGRRNATDKADCKY